MTLNEAIEHLYDILQSDKKWECEECKNEHIQLRDWLNELKSYKDLEEQGRLLKLPCAVGDTVYILIMMILVKPFFSHKKKLKPH